MSDYLSIYMEEMQLDEMMHVDIKIGIDMQSRLVTDAGVGGRSHGLFTNFCSPINKINPNTNYYSTITMSLDYNRLGIVYYLPILSRCMNSL